MGLEVAGNCLHWSQSLVGHAPFSSPQTLSSVFSSISGKGRGIDGALTYHVVHVANPRSPFLGTTGCKKLPRRRSLEDLKGIGRRSKEQTLIRRSFSASLEDFTYDNDDEADDEFVRRLHELALKLDQDESSNSEVVPDSRNQEAESSSSSKLDAAASVRIPISPHSSSSKLDISVEPPWPAIRPEPANWPDLDEIVPASVERKANSVDLPLSLRIIKRKKRWEEGFRLSDVGESACCSVKKAFSSMVFIIRELHSYTIHMREILLYENLQGILARVQAEMNASFVWLFQQIFSSTPTLMVYVMLLLANFTVHSMGHYPAFAAVPPAQSAVVSIEQDFQRTAHQNLRFDASSVVKTLSVGKTASVGGIGSGGGKARPVAGSTDDGRSDGPSHYSRTILPEGISTTAPATSATEDGSGEVAAAEEEEAEVVWSRIVDEASRMRASTRDAALMDPDTLQQLVSPVTVELEPEDYTDYMRTELMYHQALSQDPDNTLLLCNFAHFLTLVLHDHDRAEVYFKRAVGMKPADAEALSGYASFLWLVREDLGAAEETYLEAIAAEPSNSYYAANYAHFLWNTGGEDTCYPLDGDDA